MEEAKNMLKEKMKEANVAHKEIANEYKDLIEKLKAVKEKRAKVKDSKRLLETYKGKEVLSEEDIAAISAL